MCGADKTIQRLICTVQINSCELGFSLENLVFNKQGDIQIIRTPILPRTLKHKHSF